MKLTHVLGSVNNNPEYYRFIPKQIKFWNFFQIRFIAVFVGENIPSELEEYKEHIFLWNKNLDIHHAFVAQNLRIYFPALIDLPDDEMIMITDMDMLPGNDRYYKEGLEQFEKDDFIYYRNIDQNQIYMCYNASHPHTWKKIFGIDNTNDIEQKIYETYHSHYDGIPGSTGWFIDQEILYNYLIQYPKLHILNRPIRKLEMSTYRRNVKRKYKNFIKNYDDIHFHRSFSKNQIYIEDAETQLV